MKVLIIEDNFKLRENIVRYFKHFNILVEESPNGLDAISKIGSSKYDAVILDINMPFMNGKEFIRDIRSKGDNIPVIALTSNSMLSDKLEMFSLGVDDYLTKPFDMEELLARVNSITKRAPVIKTSEIVIGDILIDETHHKIYKDNIEIPLTNKEFMIVTFLAGNRGIPKNKTQILEQVWGESEESLEFYSVTLEAHISTIRKKLGKDIIKTIKQVGYVIE